VEIHTKCENNNLIISVSDEGQGIPPIEMNKLFKPFSRTSVQATSGESSTGLGLVIVRKTIEAHNGRVWAESRVKKGSTFYISLPIQ